MFRTISLPLFYLLLCSCSREVTMPVDSAASERPVTAELRITTEDMLRLATRATDEEAIRDINLYLFGRSNGQSLHFYSRSALVRFECLPGEYDLYVAANLGADLGERSVQQLRTYTIKWQEEYATLPMSAVMTVAIAPDKGTVTLPTLSVRRTVAKIAYNIRVADKVPDLELRSVRLCSVPEYTTLFTPASAPSTSEKDFTDAPLVELPDAARRSCSGVQYLFANPQGTVSSITDQRDKNADNAPACASYLMIRAARGNRTLYYRVYLGRNNTTDFNVGRNTSHTLDITISGDNEVDTRVHGYTLSVTDDFESNRIGSYCVLPFNASLYVNIERAESEPTLTGALELLTPTDGTLLVDYEECASRLDLPINHQQGSNYYEVIYYPEPLVTAAHAQLAYEVRVRDSYGYESRRRFEHRFANALYVAPPTGGTVTAARALHVEKPTGGTLRAACYEQGCTLTAKAAAGYRFAGWYADEGHSELLCGTETYSFVPETYRTWIYPYFEAFQDPYYHGHLQGKSGMRRSIRSGSGRGVVHRTCGQPLHAARQLRAAALPRLVRSDRGPERAARHGPKHYVHSHRKTSRDAGLPLCNEPQRCGYGQQLHRCGSQCGLSFQLPGAGERPRDDGPDARDAFGHDGPRTVGERWDAGRSGRRGGAYGQYDLLPYGSELRQCPYRAVRRCGTLYLVVAYLAYELRSLGHGPDLRFGIYVHGSQSRSAHNERQRSFAARTLLPVGTPRPLSSSLLRDEHGTSCVYLRCGIRVLCP
ncbi:DUF4906 domain-containing protein [Alistipes putredinis]|uniref:DUF4906 domain-containing protein n=1 Tax=Alistipes putredinis TaxID=28117 RepID=UPI003A8B0968